MASRQARHRGGIGAARSEMKAAWRRHRVIRRGENMHQ